MNIFAGNLSFDATEADVKKLFEGFGNVASVVIVMEKEKKAPKSRGFGFVQMPDEQQAFAAISALNGKEFMGRVLNVNPARPKGQKAMVWSPIAKAKTEAQAASKLKEKRQPKVKAQAEQYPWVNPGFRKLGTYKGGRRSRSYVKRRGLAGMQEEAKPRRKSQDNPMRWRKRKDQPKPWKKAEGEAKPWKKPAGDANPWRKSSERPQKSRFNGRKKLRRL